MIIAFYLSVWPMMGAIYNAIHIVNEMVVLIAIWTMFHFTLYVDDAEVRYEFGWNFLYFVGADVAINVLFLFYFVGSKIYTACKRKF